MSTAGSPSTMFAAGVASNQNGACRRGATLAAGQFIGTRFASVCAGGFELSRWVWAADGRYIEPHGHDECHIMVITSGRFRTSADGSNSAGQLPLIFNPAQTYHSDRFEKGNSSFLSISIPPSLLPQFDDCGLPGAPTQSSSIGARALALRAMREIAEWQTDSGPIVEALCVELLGMIATKSGEERSAPAWLASAVEMLNEETEDPTTSELAEHCGVHPVHLARTFRHHHRCTPGEYRRSVKLERSLKLLFDGYPLAVVAAEAGFVDQAHFTRLFRKAYGLTPGRFRLLAA